MSLIWNVKPRFKLSQHELTDTLWLFCNVLVPGRTVEPEQFYAKTTRNDGEPFAPQDVAALRERFAAVIRAAKFDVGDEAEILAFLSLAEWPRQ